MEIVDFGTELTAFSLVMNILSYGLSIACYILTALGLYTIAKRREISKPWLAWIPVANAWLLGSISDQYQYVVKGETKSRRKILLGLCIALYVCMIVLYVVLFASVFRMAGLSAAYISDNEILSLVLEILSTMLFMMIPMLAVSITYQVFYFIALYDVYRSCNPEYSTLFLVLSILFSTTQPFFLFFNRNKDRGMPPRKPDPMGQIPPPRWQPQPNPYQPPRPNYPPQPNPYQPQSPYYPPQPNPYQPPRTGYSPYPNPYLPPQPYSPPPADPQPNPSQNPQRSLDPDTAPEDSE